MQQNQNKKAYLLFGRTQTCKSSFVKDVSGGKLQIKIGEGNKGKSTTKELKSYTCTNLKVMPDTNFLFIDTIGWGDSDEQYTDDEILEIIDSFLLENTSQDHIDGIIVTESMMGDSATVENSLIRLFEIFGEQCFDSTLVLGTKSNVLDRQSLQERVDAVNSIIRSFQLPSDLLLFKTNYRNLALQPDESEKQFRELGERLKLLEKLPFEILKEKREKIKQRAQELQKEGTKSKEVSINEQKVVMDKATRNVPRIDFVENCVTRPKRILGMRVGKKRFIETVPRVTYVQEEYDVPRIESNVRVEKIEIAPDEEYCMRKAMDEFKVNGRIEFKDLRRRNRG